MNLKISCSKKLKMLNQNLTAQDKVDAEEKFSRPTIDKYLKGEVKKLQTATDLINFFEVKVNDRKKSLQKLGVN